MMAVTGAVMVLSTLPAARQGLSLALAAGDTTKRTRIGQVLLLVGPHFAKSYTARNKASSTGWSNQAVCVRASVKSCSRDASSIHDFMLCLPRVYNSVHDNSKRLSRFFRL